MSEPIRSNRYGFYYFPDCTHYRDSDIHTWIPELISTGAAWITLLAPTERAIPESFIRQVIEAGIQPVIHLPLNTASVGVSEKLQVILEAYAHWGIRYIVLFDRPNQAKNWSPEMWTQSNLVERFLDIFIPIAEATRRVGLIPVFPGLEPGGDYWDTAFLYAALQGILRRGNTELHDNLVLGAYAWPGNRSLNWGSGGPERWPNTRPYLTPQNSEDQIGFRVFDWYLALTKAAIGITRPIILIGAGSRMGDQIDRRAPAVDSHAHTWQNMTVVRLMSGRTAEFDPVPEEVLTCNFWLLSTDEGDKEINNAWFKPNKEELPVVNVLKEWVANVGNDPASAAKGPPSIGMNDPALRPISHYLLLPTFEWGVADWHLDAIRPFIMKYQPTIGFSPIEASHAKKVTVIGGATSVPESIIDGLLAAGCIVEQISADGMNIAT